MSSKRYVENASSGTADGYLVDSDHPYAIIKSLICTTKGDDAGAQVIVRESGPSGAIKVKTVSPSANGTFGYAGAPVKVAKPYVSIIRAGNGEVAATVEFD